MQFIYNAYINLLNLLFDKEYSFCSYDDWNSRKRPVVLRHDVDISLEKAVRLSEIETDQRIKACMV